MSWRLQCNHRFSLLFFHMPFGFDVRPLNRDTSSQLHPSLSLSLSSLPSFFPPNHEQAQLLAIHSPSFFVYRQIHVLVLSSLTISKARLIGHRRLPCVVLPHPLSLSSKNPPTHPSCNSNADGFFFIFILLSVFCAHLLYLSIEV